MTSAANGHSLADLLAFCYIDDLLSHSSPPRSLTFLVQRLLLVSGGSARALAAEHAAACLLHILGVHSLPPPPRQPLDTATAAELLRRLLAFANEDHLPSVDWQLVEGGKRLASSITRKFSSLGGEKSIEEHLLHLTSSASSEWAEPCETPCAAKPVMNQLVQLVQEGGASITQSEEVLKSHLARVGAVDAAAMRPAAVAAAITLMIQSPAGTAPNVLASFDRPGTAALTESPSSWNGKVWVRVLSELQPGLSWHDVVLHLDSPVFQVCNRPALILLTSILNTAFLNKPWPISLLYRDWRHKQAQISWLHQIVANPDIFCLADYPHKAVNTSCLKMQPEESNKDIANWRVLELTDTLMKVMQETAALKVMQMSMQLCSDIFLLALFQLPPPATPNRLHIMGIAVSMVLTSSHSNLVSVLNMGWNADTGVRKSIHSVILTALYNLYAKHPEDQTKLTKILDIAHELKPNGLTELFNVPQLNFTIDLACLASKRDFLKLEKWLDDKLVDHGEALTIAVIRHMTRRLPLAGSGAAAALQSGGMSHEIFSILHSFISKHQHSSATVRIEFHQLISQLQKMQMKADPPRHPVGGTASQLRPAASSFLPGFASRQPASGAAGGAVPGSFFGGSQEMLKSAGAVSSGPPLSSFGGNPLSMSPSGNMMRSAMMSTQPPGPQRQNSGSAGWSALPPAPGTSTLRATTPSMDFRPPLNPAAAVSDISARSVSSNDDLAQTTFSEDIQTEANSYFEKIYSQNSNMTVNDLLNKLKTFKNSSVVKDREVLKCVVKNLFEEYKFFKEYPERELRITAEVYGGIIREGIISNLHFATAVRKMIESLQADYNSMLWQFGIVSLNACRSKLCNYPKVCVMIMSHENYTKMPESLRAYVQHGVSGQLPPNAGRETPPWQAVPSAPLSSPSINLRPAINANINNRTGNTALSYTNVDTLVAATEKEGAEVAQPVEAIVDKVSFLFNNLSNSNLTSKRDEIRVLISQEGEGFLRWLAQYIVMKRVSIEQNFQPLYNQFVIAVDNPILDKFIKNETFRNIKILLRTDKRQAASNYNERQLLKNLGMWLGSITISRNRPIVISELDLKSLLMEAYYKGQQELLYVVPFIAKILIACSKSSPPHIFTPSCAWIHSLLKLLAELHHEPDLKINLKFEIEVLCKELSVDLQQLPVDGVLKDTERLLRVPQQLSELKQLKQPDTVGGSSPVPPQMRADGTAGEARATPVAAEAAAATPADTAAAPAATAAFHYNEINVVSPDSIVAHLKISASLPLFQLHPQMKHMVRAAVTHAIKELIGPVTERALKVALTVTENVVKKDFALDGMESNMRAAAHHMMRAMTAGMAAITCRDPLSASMMGYLTQAFNNSLRGTPQTTELAKMIEEASHQITQDNVEVTTNFIVKSACEKAAAELDKRFEGEMEARRAARAAKKVWGEQTVLAQQALMPERLRLRQAPLAPQQLAVYEEFASKICGFKSVSEEVVDGGVKSLEKASDMDVERLTTQLHFIIRDVDIALNTSKPPTHTDSWQAVSEIRNACNLLMQAPRDSAVMNKLIVLSVDQLLYAFKNTYISGGTTLDLEWSKRLRELFIGVCRVLLGLISHAELARRITSVIVSSVMEHRYNVYAIEILVRQQLLQPPVYDAHLAHIVDNGSLEAAVFATKLLKMIGGVERGQLQAKDIFPKTVDAIARAMSMYQSNRGEAIEGSVPQPSATQAAPAAPMAMMPPPAATVPPPPPPETRPSEEDSPEMQSKVELILREWIALCYTPMAQKDPQQALATMIHMMHEQGVLATDEMITRFFRLCTEMCVDVSYRLLKSETHSQSNTLLRQRCYYTLDAFVKLTCLMVKHSDGSQHQTKINLLKKVLNIVTGVLQTDHEKLRRGEFQAMPYHRIIIIMFNELTAPDSNLEPIAWNILESFGQAFFILQPRRVPAFAYAWLDIIGHRNVIARLLGESVEPVRTAAMYTQLLICHLKFLAPYLRNIELPRTISTLYKGTLRVLLVILHDFPELLCEYHYVICDAIPPNCVQLRNLVLSAYPRNMRLPDPFALSFKQVDGIPEMAQEPKMCLNVQTIMSAELRNQLDHYLNSRSSVDFLTNLSSQLQVSAQSGSKYNTAVMNAVVIYVGMRAIENLQTRGQRITMTSIAHTAYMDVFQNLAVQLCTEGRYLLFNAIANQLRFPNVHTHYFSCVFLFLFLHADSAAIKEQITRILFERLVALRPHPWGLLITFIELINNQQYSFWSNDFTRCAPEIERLFQNVANTCVTKTTAAGRAVEGPTPASIV